MNECTQIRRKTHFNAQLASFALTSAENSETQLGKDVKYKMLVRALNLDTEEELAQHVSEGFTVSVQCPKMYLVALSCLGPCPLSCVMMIDVKQLAEGGVFSCQAEQL